MRKNKFMRRLALGIIIAIAIVIAVFIFSIKPVEKPITNPELACSADSDCTAAQCCHPTSAVNKDFAPDCAEIVCTAECATGTIDCGQGSIKCINNKCTVVMK